MKAPNWGWIVTTFQATKTSQLQAKEKKNQFRINIVPNTDFYYLNELMIVL